MVHLNIFTIISLGKISYAGTVVDTQHNLKMVINRFNNMLVFHKEMVMLAGRRYL